jgi:hypothetical protein
MKWRKKTYDDVLNNFLGSDEEDRKRDDFSRRSKSAVKRKAPKFAGNFFIFFILHILKF